MTVRAGRANQAGSGADGVDNRREFEFGLTER